MKKTNFIMILILGTIPEIILGIYLKDILNKDFIDTIIFIYLILIVLGLLRFFISEISFRLLIKNDMTDSIYKNLVNNNFPNPWNYFIDDGLSYFDEVGRDVNNELLEVNVINGATTIYTQTKFLYDLNKFGQYWRIKGCLKVAVKRFMDEKFETSIDNLTLNKDNLLKIFNKFNFINPNELKFENPLMYIDLVIKSKNSNLLSKRYACKIRYLIGKSLSEMSYSEAEYGIDETSNREVIDFQIKELGIAIDIYSKENL